jgi:hypothetical protein
MRAGKGNVKPDPDDTKFRKRFGHKPVGFDTWVFLFFDGPELKAKMSVMGDYDKAIEPALKLQRHWNYERVEVSA